MKPIKKAIKLTFIICILANMITGGCGGDGCGCINTDVVVEPAANKKFGEAAISILNLSNITQSNEKVYLSVSYQGVLKEASDEGETGETTFTVNKTYEIKDGNILPQPTISRLGLKFGIWEVSVQANNWVARCNGTISPDKGGDFKFNYPSDQGNCN